jgi:predicted small lipoprotein YifL
VKRNALILACVSELLLAGCGIKGALVVPGVPENAPWPYPTPTPAPQPTPKPVPDLPGSSDEKK